MERGWVRIYRRVQDDKLWLFDKFSKGQAWIDMILLAAHADKIFLIRGNEVSVKRGQLAIAESTLSERWKWSRDKIRKFFKDLEKDGKIIQQKNRLISIYSIVNYDSFQTTDQTTDQTTEKQQKNHKQECKELKEEKNISKDPPFKEPTLEEVSDYCKQRGNSINPAKFIAYYESKGWKVGRSPMKNWKACIRTWEQNTHYNPVQPQASLLEQKTGVKTDMGKIINAKN